MTTREPEFSEDDLALLLAYQAHTRDTGRYGESITEAVSEQADPNYVGDGAIRYTAGFRVNHAEAAVEAERRRLGDDIAPGAVFYVERETYE